MRCENVN